MWRMQELHMYKNTTPTLHLSSLPAACSVSPPEAVLLGKYSKDLPQGLVQGSTARIAVRLCPGQCRRICVQLRLRCYRDEARVTTSRIAARRKIYLLTLHGAFCVL